MKIFKKKSLILSDKLNDNSNKYPYLSQLFLPVISIFSEKYDDHSFLCDWLCLPWFLSIYNDDREALNYWEDLLKDINENIGEKEYNKIVKYFHNEQSKGNTINGVHQKIYEFWAELKAISHFTKEGYEVKKIELKSSAPDLEIRKNNEIGYVECKFVNNSRDIHNYIYRYKHMLETFFPEFPILYGEDFRWLIEGSHENIHNMRPLSQENIYILQKFLKEIFFEKKNLHSAILERKIKNNSEDTFKKEKIKVEYCNEIKSNPVTLSNQLSFFKEVPCQNIYNYIKDLVKPKIISQLSNVVKNNEKKYAYLMIQFDNEFLSPFEEFQQKFGLLKNQIKELFATDNIELIIYDAAAYI